MLSTNWPTTLYWNLPERNEGPAQHRRTCTREAAGDLYPAVIPRERSDRGTCSRLSRSLASLGMTGIGTFTAGQAPPLQVASRISCRAGGAACHLRDRM